MIIACSAKALQIIEKAIFERLGKDEIMPLILSDKESVEKVTTLLAEDPVCFGAVWNIDIEESPIKDREGNHVGQHKTGYLTNRDLGASVVLNGLDCVDLCNIGSVAIAGIKTILTDFVIIPQAIEKYLESLHDVMRKVLDEKIDRKKVSSMSPQTLLFANKDRSAAAMLKSAKDTANEVRYRGGVNYISSEPIDRSLSFDLNRRIAKVRNSRNTIKEYVVPLTYARKILQAECQDLDVPAVKVRIQLYDNFEEAGFSPASYRDVIVPLEAPLSWIHQMIQKVFNWADYHLHHFAFLEKNANNMLSDAFNDLFEVETFGKGDSENAFRGENGEEHFISYTHLSLRWVYGDFVIAMRDEGVADGDFPFARLPESMPSGLAILGSTSYPDVLSRLSDPKESMAAKELGCNALNYHYDYGDGWELSITPIEFLVAKAQNLPIIVDAQGHTPPEDCGGLGGFADFLRAIDPDDDYDREDIDILAWAKGNGWRPFTSVEDLRDQFDTPSTWGGW